MTAGDESFWLSTFEEHGSSILAFLRSRLGRRDLAEDLLQETFVRAMRTARTGAGPALLGRPAGPGVADGAGIRSYLFTTAHHLILDRARRKRPVLFSEMPERESARVDRTAGDPAASPEAAASLRDIERRIRAVLERVPAAQRMAFEQAVLHERPYAEVAAEQGWTLSQVKTNVHRARKKVMAELSDLLQPQVESE